MQMYEGPCGDLLHGPVCYSGPYHDSGNWYRTCKYSV